MAKRIKVDRTLVFLILLNVFVISFIKLHDQNKYIKTKNGIEKNGEFGICEITLFSSGTIRQVGTIRISYQYKNQTYEGDIVGPYTKHVKKGDYYVVMFDATKLKRCVVLFDYQVTDSTQFLKDVEYLKQHPPTPRYESLIWKRFQNKEKLW